MQKRANEKDTMFRQEAVCVCWAYMLEMETKILFENRCENIAICETSNCIRLNFDLIYKTGVEQVYCNVRIT